MNILMVTDVYFPRINGVSTSIQTFKRELEALGHRVCVIAPDYPQQYENEPGVMRVESRKVLMDPEDRMMKKSVALSLVDELKLMDFDLVHIQTPFVAHYLGVKLAKLLNIPKVVSYHTFFEEYLFHYLPYVPKKLMQWIARRFSRAQCNQVDSVVVPSTAMQSVLEGYGVQKPTEIIPTGIYLPQRECDEQKLSQFRSSLDIARDRPCLVHVGRIAYEKNIEFLIHVIYKVKRRIQNLAVIIAGEGPALKDIKALSHELGLSDTIYFTGYLDRGGSLQDCYCSGDAFIFASKTETQGLVLLEAMALGVPVVSTAIMGTKDILKAAQGALVAADDSDDFTAKIMRLLTDHGLRTSLGNQARVYAQQWSASEMAQQMLRFYSSVLKQRQSISTSRAVVE
ncbi:MAG: glycosyltransferase [Gammaproteobacteria bacterium]